MQETDSPAAESAVTSCGAKECAEVCEFALKMHFAANGPKSIERIHTMCVQGWYDVVCPQYEGVIDVVLRKGDLAHQSLLRGLIIDTPTRPSVLRRS